MTFKIKEKEKEYMAMTVEKLREIARKTKISRNGGKAEIIKRLLDEASGREKSPEQVSLEGAIKSWSCADQRDFLARMKKPNWGNKATMTERIMESVGIDESVEIVKEYRESLVTMTDAMDEEEDDSGRNDNYPKDVEMVSDEKKRKRSTLPGNENISEDGEMDDEESDPKDITDIDIMDIDEEDKSKEDTRQKKKEGHKKKEVPRRQKAVEEENEVVCDRILQTEIDGKEPPPMIVVGKTSDKDTDFSASARGGNDLGNDVDEAGWQAVSRDDDSVVTTKVDNIRRTRIGILLTPPPAKEPDKKLCLEAQKWFGKMKEIDNKFTLLPWKKQDEDKPSVKIGKKIPNLMSKMRVYLSRAQAKSDGGKVYADVFIQHSIPIAELRGDAEWFLTENKMGMYNKDLQVESTERKGWFLYSTASMDTALLAEKIEDEIGVTVALRWKYINTEKYEQLDRDERKKWMALHIEVATKDGKKATRGLSRLYGSQSSAFPLGIRMRLVSEFREVKGNSIMMGKHTRLRLRQSSFNAMMVGHPVDDIMLLDYKSRDGGVTLRSLIMKIQSNNPETPGNLFHAVGKDWKGRIIINYLKIKTNEAAMIADGLIPYLDYKYGDKVREFFDPEAVLEKEDWYWDEEQKTIVNPLSKELDGLEAVDNDYDFSEVSPTINNTQDKSSGAMSAGFVLPKTAAELAAARLNMVVTGGDEDSVSTMGNPLSPASITAHRQSSLLPAIGISSGSSVRSTATMDTRISTIEQNMQIMEMNIQKRFDSSMDKLFSRLQESQSVKTTHEPPGGATAGGVND